MKYKKQHKLIYKVILITQLFFFQLTSAQPGSLDLSFNPSDVGYNYGDGIRTLGGGVGDVKCIAIQSDGKIIIGGDFDYYNNISRNNIARLNIDGTLDLSFNPGTSALGIVYAISIQSNGKVIVGGDLAGSKLLKLNIDGTVDTTFASINPGSSFNPIYTASIQNDGKIIIAGSFGNINGIVRNSIARLNSDGTVDTSFNTTTGWGSPIFSTAIQSDGKIIVAGTKRLNTNGSNDTTFTLGSGANGTVFKTVIQSNGKILIGGAFNACSGISRNKIARMNINGTLDTTFDTGVGPGGGTSSAIEAISVQNDGKIIVGGGFSTYNGITKFGIVRLNNDGTLDSSFNTGRGTSGIVRSSVIKNDGKIIIVGTFYSYNHTERNGIASLNVDGTIDLSLNPGTAATNTVLTSSIQSDGKIIIGGVFTVYNGTARNGIARINIDGTIDNTFNPGQGATRFSGIPYVKATAIQSDGKIIIAGSFNSYNGTTRESIARLNSDGTLDTSFNPGTGTYYAINTVSIQSDGKIIIGGDFISFNGISQNYLTRLNADGTLDLSFNIGTGFNFGVNTTCVQSDGKIIVGGKFNNFNGYSNRYRIVRLNSNGSIDLTFNNPGINQIGNQYVYTSAIQSDGKIIIGGNFTSINGNTRHGVARLNVNGTLDANFNTDYLSFYIGGEVHTILIQSDGKIIIGGGIGSSYNISGNLIHSYGIGRLNSNGILDETFNYNGSGTWTGLSQDIPKTINTASIQNDGKIIIGGDFTSYNGAGRNRIARLNNSGLLSNSNFEKRNVLIYPNPNNGKFTIQIDDINYGSRLEIYDLLGQKIFSNEIFSNETVIDFINNDKGVYIYKLYNINDGIKTGKIIVE